MCVSNSMCYPHRGRHHPNTAIGKSDTQVLQEVLPDSDVDFRLVILMIVVLGVPLSKSGNEQS